LANGAPALAAAAAPPPHPAPRPAVPQWAKFSYDWARDDQVTAM
jgi:hypothetical protein